MRMLSIWRVVVAIGVAFTLAGSPALAQAGKDGVDMRPKFKAGQDTKYRMQISQTAKSKSKDAKTKDTERDMLADLGGEENTDHEIKFSLKVKQVNDDGTSHVDLVYDSVKVTGEMNGDKVSMDSTKPASTDKGEQAAMLRGMAGTTISLVIDKDGNIKETKGGGGLLGEGGSDLLGPIFSPGKAPGSARLGQSWTNIDEIGMGGLVGPMRLVTTHTLENVNNGEARVNVVGKIDAGEESPGGGGKGKEMIKITKSDHSGSYVWDLDRGQIKSMSSTMKSELKVDLGGMDMTRTGDTVMKLERVSVEPVTKPAPPASDKPKDDPKPQTDSGGKPGPKRK